MSLIWGVLCLKIILLAFLPLLWKCYTLMCFFVGHGIYVNPELFRQTSSFQPRVRVHNEACELSSELVDPIETFETSGIFFFNISEQDLVEIGDKFNVSNDKIIMTGTISNSRSSSSW